MDAKHLAPRTTLRAVGMNDEQTTCDRCGKLELRGTVIVADDDNCEVGRYGTTCAGKVVGYSLRAANVRLVEMARRQRVASEIGQARTALSDGAAGWALAIVRDVRKFQVVHLASERDALVDVEATATAMVPDADAAVAAFVADMRRVRSVASGSGVTIGFEFDGATQIYRTERAAYLALVAR
jgi:hypothetical protein